MTDTATLQARLADAEAALHELVLGRARVSASYEGRSITWTQADIPQLRAYIAELRAQLGTAIRRPLGVSW